MAAIGERNEVELLSDHVDVVGLDKSGGNAWASNVILRDGKYQVRKGFGLLARYGTTFNNGRTFNPDQTKGYIRTLGSTLVVTNQGHEQILTIGVVKAYTADLAVDSANAWVDKRGRFLNTFVLSVYDATTDRRVEFPFLVKTAETNTINTVRLLDSLPVYQTNKDRDLQRFVPASDSIKECSFVNFEGTTYIIIPTVGVWQYRPINPTKNTDRKVGSVNASQWQPHGEQTALSRMVPANGPFINSYTYYTNTTFQTPSCATVCGNRMVWASDRSIYFSDPDVPNHILAANVYVVPSKQPITAIQSIRDTVVIFCGPQVYLYQPSQSDAFQSGGRLVELSVASGPISQNHTVKMGDGIVFVDTSGVSLLDSGGNVTILTETIAPWFQDGVPNPSSQYKVANGVTNLAVDQPRLQLDLPTAVLGKTTLAWHDHMGTLFVTFEDFTLMWRQSSGWVVWLYETDSVPSGGPVKATSRIPNPCIVPGNTTRLFLVSGPTNTTYVDVTDGSIDVLEYGRGGYMDLTSTSQEDRREPTGGWVKQSGVTATVPSAFYIGEAIPKPIGWVTDNQTTTDQTWLLPVFLQSDRLVGQYELRFTFNKNDWKFLLDGAQVGSIDFVTPNDRLPSEPGYQRGAMDATHQVRVHQGGAPSNTGNEVRISFDGFTTVGWDTNPSINAAFNAPGLLLYLPIQRNGATTSVLDHGVTVSTAQVVEPGPVAHDADAYVWQQSHSYPEQSLDGDVAAQPIDWAIQTKEYQTGAQSKYRGAYMRILSYGEATDRDTIIYGPLNMASSTDYRAWSGQRNDWADTPAGIQEVVDVTSIRERMKQLNLTTPVSYKTGNNIAKWGDSGNGTKGNLLIDDPAVNTIATSEGVRGESFTTLVHGSLAHPGEHVEVGSLRAEYIIVGGRRRTGR